MNKKLVVLGIIGSLGLAGAVAIPLIVSANDNVVTTNQVNNFVEQLAKKLGLDTATVQSAVDSVKTDIKTTRDAENATAVANAVTAGSLTQRQADILIALQGLQLDPPTRSTTDWSTLTEDQRKAEIEADKAAKEQQVVDALNANGLNTTLEEVQAARVAARTAGIRVGEMGFGRGGFGEGPGKHNKNSAMDF